MPSNVVAMFKKEGYTVARLARSSKVRAKCPAGHSMRITAAEWRSGRRCKHNCKVGQKRQRKSRGVSTKRWAKKVIATAGKLCQCCRDPAAKNLEAHHLYSYAHYPDQRHKLENGMCLCRACHADFHKVYGYGKNTPSQMTAYLLTRK